MRVGALLRAAPPGTRLTHAAILAIRHDERFPHGHQATGDSSGKGDNCAFELAGKQAESTLGCHTTTHRSTAVVSEEPAGQHRVYAPFSTLVSFNISRMLSPVMNTRRIPLGLLTRR